MPLTKVIGWIIAVLDTLRESNSGRSASDLVAKGRALRDGYAGTSHCRTGSGESFDS